MSDRGYPKKVWFLLVFALLSLALLLATLFTGLTEVDLDLRSSVPLGLGTEPFATAVEGVVGARRQPVDPSLQLFDDGDVFLSDLLAEIAKARGSVTVTNYIFREGHMTDALFAALAKRAREGIEVRLLTDGNGGKNAPEDGLREIEEAGGEVDVFRPLGIRSLTRLHRRTHVRAIAIDGRVAYVGGFAIDDEWLGDGTGPRQWRDVMFKLHGEMARATQDQFNALWRQTDGEILSGPDFYPQDVAAPAADSAVATAADSAAAVADGAAGWFVGLFHRPAPDLSADLQDLVWLSLAGAGDHVLITTPYMTPAAAILNAIMAAARRGVRVEILMPGPYTDAKLVQAATRARYRDLLEAGVRIFEYQPGRFHAKTLTADGHWSVIGSANLDNRSATLNVENVFAVEDRRLAGMLEAEFEADRARSVEVTLETFRPNPLQVLYFNVARVFAKQY